MPETRKYIVICAYIYYNYNVYQGVSYLCASKLLAVKLNTKLQHKYSSNWLLSLEYFLGTKLKQNELIQKYSVKKENKNKLDISMNT